jgi:hypothetical protein
MADILLDKILFLARNVRQVLESRATNDSLTRFMGSRGCQRRLK